MPESHEDEDSKSIGRDDDPEIAGDSQNTAGDSVGDDASGSIPIVFGTKISPPITLLQEICSRNGFTAEYQLLSTEGSVHEPTFKIAVTVADITVTASGQSKKKARHAAAREAIDKLRQRTDLNFDGVNFESMSSVVEQPTKSVYAIAASEANPVGKLQEICMKMRVNPPDYDTCDERGLAHERIFVLSCSIASLNLTTLGDGRSKKLAKRQAAEHMLAKLESFEIYDKTSNSKANDHGISSLNMDSDDNSHFVKTRRLITELCAQLDSTVSDLWYDVNMIETDNVNPDLFYDLFQETVSRVGSCQFTWISDMHCLLHVYDREENVVMTSFGSSDNNSSAMKNAVINAYKLMMVLMNPLTGTSPQHLHLKYQSVIS